MLACISGTVGIYAMQQHLYSDSTRIGQSYPLLIIMAFTVVLIMAIYGVAVARTATREIGKINYKPNSYQAYGKGGGRIGTNYGS